MSALAPYVSSEEEAPLSRLNPFDRLSLDTIIMEISNAFVGTIKDLFDAPKRDTPTIMRVFEKDRRYMYIALLVLLVLITSDVLSNFDL